MAAQVPSPRGGPISAINVTPMADVMIVLLIIFMVTIPAIATAPVALPPAQTGEAAPEDRMTIVVRSDGSTALGDQAVPLDVIRLRLDERGESTPVWITADAAASYASVEAVLHACRSAGVDVVGLEVQPSADRRM